MPGCRVPNFDDDGVGVGVVVVAVAVVVVVVVVDDADDVRRVVDDGAVGDVLVVVGDDDDDDDAEDRDGGGVCEPRFRSCCCLLSPTVAAFSAAAWSAVTCRIIARIVCGPTGRRFPHMPSPVGRRSSRLRTLREYLARKSKSRYDPGRPRHNHVIVEEGRGTS